MNTLIITVINQSSNNVGDDLAATALAIQIRTFFPKAELHFIYEWDHQTNYVSFSDALTTHHPWEISTAQARRAVLAKLLHLPMLQRSAAVTSFIEQIRRSDLVVVSPGGATIGHYQNTKHLWLCLLTVLYGKKPLFHLNTIGKSHSFVFDQFAKYIMHHSTVFVREQKSAMELQAWGVFCQQGVDTAFSLPPLYADIDANHSQPYLVLIPSNLPTWFPGFSDKQYTERFQQDILQQVAAFANLKQLLVYLLPHQTDYRVNIESDYYHQVIATLKDAGLRQEARIIEIRTCHEYDYIIANASIVLSTRYHGIVAAAKNAVPFISLSYENKMREVCRYTKMLSYWHDMENIDGSLFSAQLTNAYENSIQIIDQLKQAYPRLNSLAKLPLMICWLNQEETYDS